MEFLQLLELLFRIIPVQISSASCKTLLDIFIVKVLNTLCKSINLGWPVNQTGNCWREGKCGQGTMFNQHCLCFSGVTDYPASHIQTMAYGSDIILLSGITT